MIKLFKISKRGEYFGFQMQGYRWLSDGSIAVRESHLKPVDAVKVTSHPGYKDRQHAAELIENQIQATSIAGCDTGVLVDCAGFLLRLIQNADTHTPIPVQQEYFDLIAPETEVLYCKGEQDIIVAEDKDNVKFAVVMPYRQDSHTITFDLCSGGLIVTPNDKEKTKP